MAHFAQIDDNNVVIQVIVVNNQEMLDENGVESEQKGIHFCESLFGGNWVQTSYNSNFRKHFAGFNYTYDSDRDAFIPPQKYDSWILDEELCDWVSPVPYPSNLNENQTASWDEESTSWLITEYNKI